MKNYLKLLRSRKLSDYEKVQNLERTTDEGEEHMTKDNSTEQQADEVMETDSEERKNKI